MILLSILFQTQLAPLLGFLRRSASVTEGRQVSAAGTSHQSTENTEPREIADVLFFSFFCSFKCIVDAYAIKK